MTRRYRRHAPLDGDPQQCAKCDRVLPASEFRLQKGRWVSAWCHDCYVARTRQWRGDNHERLLAERRAQYPPRTVYAATPCASCGVPFVPKVARGRFCSPMCRADSRVQAEQSAERIEAKRANERLRPLVIAKYGWTCQLCGGRIDRTLSGHDRTGLTLDHIVPVIQGGPDTLDNLRPAHRWCNGARNARSGLTEEQALKGYLYAEIGIRARERWAS